MTAGYLDAVKKEMKSKGWKIDRDDDKYLNFSLYVDENTEWMKDYDKKLNRWFHYNGRDKISLISSKVKDE